MRVLAESIMAKYNASAMADTFDLYHQRAPEGTRLPYITFFFVDGVPQDTFDNKYIESWRVQFSCWSDKRDDPGEAMDMYELLRAVFDRATLTVAGYNAISMQRETQRPIQDPDGGWQYMVEYMAIIQEK